jgi:hypothetical protein
MRLISHSSLAAPIVALAMLVSANTVTAQKTETIEGGRTTITFASEIIPALGSLGITLGTVNPSELDNGVATFPVVGGAIDLDTGVGQVFNSGGLTLTSGNTQIVLQSFMLDTASGLPVITGLVSVNGSVVGRVPIFDLQMDDGLALPLTPQKIGQLSLDGVNLSLDSAAANAINNALNGSAVSGGIEIGSACFLVTLPV